MVDTVVPAMWLLSALLLLFTEEDVATAADVVVVAVVLLPLLVFSGCGGCEDDNVPFEFLFDSVGAAIVAQSPTAVVPMVMRCCGISLGVAVFRYFLIFLFYRTIYYSSIDESSSELLQLLLAAI